MKVPGWKKLVIMYVALDALTEIIGPQSDEWWVEKIEELLIPFGMSGRKPLTSKYIKAYKIMRENGTPPEQAATKVLRNSIGLNSELIKSIKK